MTSNTPRDREKELIILFQRQAKDAVPQAELSYVLRCEGLGPGLYFGLTGVAGNTLTEKQSDQLRILATDLAFDENYSLDATTEKVLDIEGERLDLTFINIGNVIPIGTRPAAAVTAQVVPVRTGRKFLPYAIAGAVACMMVVPALYMSMKLDSVNKSMTSLSTQVKSFSGLTVASQSPDLRKERALADLMARVESLESKNAEQTAYIRANKPVPINPTVAANLQYQKDYAKLSFELKNLKVVIDSIPKDGALNTKLSQVQSRILALEASQRALEKLSSSPSAPQSKYEVVAPQVVRKEPVNVVDSAASVLTTTDHPSSIIPTDLDPASARLERQRYKKAGKSERTIAVPVNAIVPSPEEPEKK